MLSGLRVLRLDMLFFAEFGEDKNEQQQRQLISRFAFGFAPAFGRAVGRFQRGLRHG
jgi:hypothetical protein